MLSEEAAHVGRGRKLVHCCYLPMQWVIAQVPSEFTIPILKRKWHKTHFHSQNHK